VKKEERTNEKILASEQTFFDSFYDDENSWEVKKLREQGWVLNPDDYQPTLKIWGFDRNLDGMKILDCACGMGFLSILLAKQGAEVFAFDISSKSVEITKERAKRNGLEGRIHVMQSSFEDLDLPTEDFDFVIGKNILHHILDLESVARKIRALLKPGGKGIFYELSAANPVLMFFRRHLVGRTRVVPKLGTPDEHPITEDEIEMLSRVFDGKCDVRYPKFRFFVKFDRQVLRERVRPISRLCEAVDRGVYDYLPPLRKYSYKIMIELEK
jgi:2-polyprenyl-3-methyl-5-hydroxy-6-metoxy-1,4-benzoquinol methylase